MVTKIFGMFTTSFVYSVNWFEDILNATGMTGIFLAGIFLALLSKFILAPIFGSAGSDKVTKRKTGGKNE